MNRNGKKKIPEKVVDTVLYIDTHGDGFGSPVQQKNGILLIKMPDIVCGQKLRKSSA